MRRAEGRRLAGWRAAALAAAAACAPPSGQAAPTFDRSAAPQPESRPFGTWSLICLPSQAQACSLSQVVARDREGKQVVLGVSVLVPAGAAKPRIDFRMSPQAMSAAGLGLKTAQGQEYRLKMSRCDESACLASGWLDGELRKALENEPAAQVAFFMQGKQQVLVPLALDGFKAGTQELERLAGVRGSAAGRRGGPAAR